MEHLKNEPSILLGEGIIDKQQFDELTKRNEFALSQIKDLRDSIKQFIREANVLTSEWNRKG